MIVQRIWWRHGESDEMVYTIKKISKYNYKKGDTTNDLSTYRIIPKVDIKNANVVKGFQMKD